MYKLYNVIAIAMAFLIISCSGQDERRQFFSHPRDDWLKNVSVFTPEKQYDYYMYGFHNVSPPAMELAIPLASSNEGQLIALDRLNNANSPEEIEAVENILVLAVNKTSSSICRNNRARSYVIDNFVRKRSRQIKDLMDKCHWKNVGSEDTAPV